jgi:hypothetical protein
MSEPLWQLRLAAQVTAWARTDPTVQWVHRNIPEWVNVTNVQAVLIAARVIGHVGPELAHAGHELLYPAAELAYAQPEPLPAGPEPISTVLGMLRSEDPITEDQTFEAARNASELAELVAGPVQEVPQPPEAVTSVAIGGAVVEAEVAEINALQADHEATLQMLHEDLNRALKERADKDAALAENLPADLGPGGQKMLEDAQAANQQQIKDNYAAEEANLRLQQGSEMAGLQAKQVAEQNRDGR